ncbi:MAG: hypothetical protein GY863_13220 [bacterium]|nr:hypothetical protein [bacterium]
MTDNTDNKRIIIGIGSKARQGKDTAAEYLEEKYGCRVVHFADALYDECRNSNILYKTDTNTLYLKAYDEEYFELPDPPLIFLEWLKEKAFPKNDLPYDADLFYGGMTEKEGTLLQFWGTEFRRKQFDWDYWVDKVKEQILGNPDMDYLVPDTRFKNEASMVKELGGFVWRINRPGFIAKDRDPNHKSEIDLDDWKFEEIITNDGTIPELHKKAESIYRKLKGLPL